MTGTIDDYSSTLGIAIGSISGIIIALINSGGKTFFNKDSKKIAELKSHDVFVTMHRVLNEVHHTRFYTDKKFDKVKTKMCYDFTKYKVENCEEHMLALLTTAGIDKMSSDKLKLLITQSQIDMHLDYVAAIKADWLARGIPIDDVEYIVHLFETFRYDVVNSFEHRITAIFGSTFHSTNFEKVLAVFNMWAMGIDLLPRDMETTFENLNGKFKNVPY
tara:strand:- start:3197 stop:3850 length:654 start_codon:yes stop_codon:yes gene_type:complete